MTQHIELGSQASILNGVNYVFLSGKCTPRAVDTTYLLLDNKGKPLNVKSLLLMKVYISSDPPLDATSTVSYTLVGFTEDLSSYTEYLPFIQPNSVGINLKYYQNIAFGNISASDDYVKNYSHPIPAILVEGPGTVTQRGRL